MHVALISHDYPPQPHSGIGSFTASLAEGLADAGQRATVFAVNPAPNRHADKPEREESVRNGVRVIRLCLRSPVWMRWRPGVIWQRLRLLRALKAEHRKTPFDLLESADAWGWLPFARVQNVPVVTRLHGAMFFIDHVTNRMTGDAFVHRLERRSLARSDFIIAVSEYIAREEMRLSTPTDAPVRVIYNAVDTDFFSPASDPAVEKGLIVYVNSINYLKGVYELCDAMNIVAQSHPEAHLVMIGAPSGTSRNAKPIEEDLRDVVRPAFRNRVRILGRHESPEVVRDYLRMAQVCCYPSHLESFGISPAEAMSVAKPTIYTRRGAGPEVVVDGESGLLCNPKDPKDIARQIERVLDDPGLAERLGAEARKRVVKLFNRRDWIRHNVQFYESCARRNS